MGSPDVAFRGDTEGGNLLCFDLCGEHVGDLPEEYNKHRDACSLSVLARPNRDGMKYLLRFYYSLESMLETTWVCEGVIVMNEQGFPVLHTRITQSLNGVTLKLVTLLWS